MNYLKIYNITEEEENQIMDKFYNKSYTVHAISVNSAAEYESLIVQITEELIRLDEGFTFEQIFYFIDTLYLDITTDSEAEIDLIYNMPVKELIHLHM